MAGATGAKPKPPGQAVHRNQTLDWTEVPDVPFRKGPKLATTMPDGTPWPPGTKQWWQVISRMPHCVLWTEADWEFAKATAVIAATFFARPSAPNAAELRNREKYLGVMWDARRDLRIRYVPAADKADLPADVASMDDYRAV